MCLSTDVKRLVRSFVYGSLSQQSPTAKLFVQGGVLDGPMRKRLGIGAGRDILVLNVAQDGSFKIQPRKGDIGNTIVALGQITIRNDPGYNKLPSTLSMYTIEQPIIRTTDVVQAIIEMERRNRPIKTQSWTGAATIDRCHIFLEGIEPSWDGDDYGWCYRTFWGS